MLDIRSQVLKAGALAGMFVWIAGSAVAGTPVDAKRLLNAASNNSEWLMYSRTYDEQRFSPLTKIN